jgi:peptidoglycan/LPS O-acetylase OafA/YrhL
VSSAQKTQLQSIQALRGIAALLVVLFHAAAIWREWVGAPQAFQGVWDQGWAGVDLFFVISGFIMVWVAGDRPQGARVAGRFVLDRATRIYPLWWVYCLVMAGYFFIAYGQPASPVSTDRTWVHLFLSLGLWPQTMMPVLPVGWTLIYEIGFYVVFGALLLLPQRWRGGVFVVWGAGLLYMALTSPTMAILGASWWDIWLNPLCLEFLFGAGLAYMCQAKTISLRWAIYLVVFGTGLFALSLIAADTAWTSLRVWTMGIPSALILFGLVQWERQSPNKVPNWLRRLGDASYTLYLSHFLILLALKRLLMAVNAPIAPTALSFALFCILGTLICAALSIALYRYLEQPLLRFVRWPLAKSPRASQS